MCCGNPLQGKLLPVGWKLAQWSYELEKGAIFCFHPTKVFGCPLGPPAWSIGSDSLRVLSVSQSFGHKSQNYTKCLQQPVFPGGHPSKY